MTVLGLIRSFVVLAAAVQFAGIALALLRQRRRGAAPQGARPPVSIIRPVCGIENYVSETLASTFAIDYPEFEVVFCVASADDPVVPLVEELIAAHPEVPSRLLVGDDRISINPKLNNLVKGWAAIRHRFTVMVDSNVLMPCDAIDQLLERWDARTGLVCSPPSGSRPDGMGAEIECAFLNTYQARWQFIADALGVAFAQGKAMFWRRDILDDAGGIAALATQPAEDAAATKIVRAVGLKVRLVRRAFEQPLGHRPFREVWKRQLRWARLRRDTFKAWFALEILPGGFLPLVAGGVLVAMGALAWEWLLALAVAWYGAEIAMARLSGWPLTLRMPFLFVLRDLMLPVLWGAAWTGSTFVWRGNPMDMRTVKPPTASARRLVGLAARRSGLDRPGMRSLLRRWTAHKEIG